MLKEQESLLLARDAQGHLGLRTWPLSKLHVEEDLSRLVHLTGHLARLARRGQPVNLAHLAEDRQISFAQEDLEIQTPEDETSATRGAQDLVEILRMIHLALRDHQDQHHALLVLLATRREALVVSE